MQVRLLSPFSSANTEILNNQVFLGSSIHYVAHGIVEYLKTRVIQSAPILKIIIREMSQWIVMAKNKH